MTSQYRFPKVGSQAIKLFSAGSLAAMLLGASGCTTDPYTGEQQVSKAAVGAAIGAAVGAAGGAATGDGSKERRKRALIGAGVGALAGAGVGAYMDAQERKLRAQLQGTGVSVSRIGDRIVLNMPGNITFDTNSAAIRSGFYDVLHSVAVVMQEYDKTIVDVEGHTDNTGSTEYNQGLSERRAEAVSAYLRAQGLAPIRVVAYGSGEHKPVASNASPDGRQLNRRVELILEPLTNV